MARPVGAATTMLTCDALGRVETVDTSDGYIVAFAYDALNRVTSRANPDATTETFKHDRLDLTQVKDRPGRITRHFYDGYGRRIATREPGGRTVSYVWSKTGMLDALVNAKGQRTIWEREINGRVTGERADGTTDTTYTYDLAGRLKAVTDPMDQVTTETNLEQGVFAIVRQQTAPTLDKAVKTLRMRGRAGPETGFRIPKVVSVRLRPRIWRCELVAGSRLAAITPCESL